MVALVVGYFTSSLNSSPEAHSLDSEGEEGAFELLPKDERSKYEHIFVQSVAGGGRLIYGSREKSQRRDGGW